MSDYLLSENDYDYMVFAGDEIFRRIRTALFKHGIRQRHREEFVCSMPKIAQSMCSPGNLLGAPYVFSGGVTIMRDMLEHEVFEAYFEVKLLMALAAATDAPILSRKAGHRASSGNGVRASGSQRHGIDSRFGLYQLLRSELSSLPQHRCFKEALDERETRAFQDLREAMDEWDHAIVEGRLDRKEYLQRQISLAERDLHRAKQLRKASRILVKVGIPIGIAELLVGIPGLGLSVSSMGACSRAVSKMIEEKYHWYFGGL